MDCDSRISIELLDTQHINEFCVYRIWFGCHFYIGSTVDITNRIISHTNAISLCMNFGVREGQNSITTISKHLSLNSSITTAFFEVIDTCISEVELVEVEYNHLYNSYNNPFCLNVSKSTSRKIGGEIYRPQKAKETPIVTSKWENALSKEERFAKKLRKSLIRMGFIQ